MHSQTLGLMNSLQNYYAITIRENTGDVQALYKAISLALSTLHSSLLVKVVVLHTCPSFVVYRSTQHNYHSLRHGAVTRITLAYH